MQMGWRRTSFKTGAKPKMPSTSFIRDDLSLQGRDLLRLLLRVIAISQFRLGDPSTYIGYWDCCDHLGLIKPGMEIPWGRLLQQNGLNDLKDWTMRNGLPAVSGLIVNVSGDRAWYPSGDYFKSHSRPDPDFDWWKDEVAKTVNFKWNPYL
jgi:hypothetical protein